MALKKNMLEKETRPEIYKKFGRFKNNHNELSKLRKFDLHLYLNVHMYVDLEYDRQQIEASVTEVYKAGVDALKKDKDLLKVYQNMNIYEEAIITQKYTTQWVNNDIRKKAGPKMKNYIAIRIYRIDAVGRNDEYIIKYTDKDCGKGDFKILKKKESKIDKDILLKFVDLRREEKWIKKK